MFEELDKLLCRKENTILFAGIGNVLRSDDGIGVYISAGINNRRNISSISVESGIENYIGKINSLNPGILVLVDCADFGSSPGSFELIEIEKVKDLSFTTHNISLRRISEFFKMPVYVLAVQPEKIDFGENISYIVKNKADMIIKHINHRR
jgi:hydrogenase maturation protease